ncbi:MAG: acyltransferase family protein [Candidatus Hodarchaeota archaeon]
MNVGKNETRLTGNLFKGINIETHHVNEPIESSSAIKRMLYIDNTRVYLTILVILHHLAICFGGSGHWAIEVEATDPISPILLLLFNGVNQAYFMSLFFFLSAYFSPRSYNKKGPKEFMKDRLIRLGIPVLVYIFILSPIVSFLLLKYVWGEEISLFTILDIIVLNIEQFNFSVGPLWFVVVLLIFTTGYAFYRLIVDNYLSKYTFIPYENSFPTNKAIIVSIISTALLTFVVRLWFPEGMEVIYFQLGHYVHYIFWYIIGIMAYHGNWLNHLTALQARYWGKVTLVGILAFFPSLILMLVLNGGEEGLGELIAGGWHWQALLVATWSSVLCFSISIWLLAFFKRKYNHQSPFVKLLSKNAYTVYIIHIIMAIVVVIPLLSIDLPSIVKLIIASMITIPLCFILAHLIRKIPFSSRVLG